MSKVSTKPPRVDVVDRSLQTDDLEAIIRQRESHPFGSPSAPIGLTDASLFPRWFNSAKAPGAIYAAKQNGWRPVVTAMLVNRDQVGEFSESVEGAVTRGERGQEVLMCIPRPAYQRIMLAKTKENNRMMGNPNAQKQALVEALGAKDSEGADFLHKHGRMGGGPIGGIHDSYERIAVEPSDE